MRARAVLVTVPLGVLRAPRGAEGAIAFSPEPRALRAAAARLESGPIVKLVLRFTEPVWPEGTSFLHAPSAPFPTFWTALPDPSPVITAWAGGGAALPLTALPRDALIAQALSTLRGLLGGPPLGRKLAGAWMHDWQADPYARGGYAWVPMGSVGAERALAAPIEGTLFFAGEATDPERSGTVDGALASGARAAREVERALSTSRRTGGHRAGARTDESARAEAFLRGPRIDAGRETTRWTPQDPSCPTTSPRSPRPTPRATARASCSSTTCRRTCSPSRRCWRRSTRSW